MMRCMKTLSSFAASETFKNIEDQEEQGGYELEKKLLCGATHRYSTEIAVATNSAA